MAHSGLLSVRLSIHLYLTFVVPGHCVRLQCAPWRQLSIRPSARVAQLSIRPSASVAQLSIRPSARVAQLSIRPSASVAQLSIRPSARVAQLSIRPSARVAQLSIRPSARPSLLTGVALCALPAGATRPVGTVARPAVALGPAPAVAAALTVTVGSKLAQFTFCNRYTQWMASRGRSIRDPGRLRIFTGKPF